MHATRECKYAVRSVRGILWESWSVEAGATVELSQMVPTGALIHFIAFSAFSVPINYVALPLCSVALL